MRAIGLLYLGLLLVLVGCTPGLINLERGEAAFSRGELEQAKDECIAAKNTYRSASGLVKAWTSDEYKARVNTLGFRVAEAMEKMETPAATPTAMIHSAIATPTPDVNETVAKLLKDAGCKDGHSLYDLIRANPYSVGDKCYSVQLKTRQILGRHVGLYGLSNADFGAWAINDVGDFDLWCYLDFGKADAPTMAFSGIAKGTGVYRYTTTSGAIRVIPKLKVTFVGPATK